ncbi:hypothetical protein MKZ38_000437 [Zalerion maritima]|uniref:Uncharacterized protein n=1 Tax=Zalerion maritima TaxID=339359 RepID=A0AAD5RZI4_9PEZI|nr:hypothetical protein MKZ38_000437 [Zalerion maritima]
MAYLLYSITVLILILVTAAYFTRASWHPLLDNLTMRFPAVNIQLPFSGARSYLYARLPQTFAGDVEAGLSSSTFDLASNIEGGDSRAGLDDTAKREILLIMKRRRLKFDEARRAYMEDRFSANGIGPDGRPRDPKFVSFS